LRIIESGSMNVAEFEWRKEFELGNERMDSTHREFVALVDGLLMAGDAAFPALFEEFIRHTEAHFAEESKSMHACGFPPIHCHEGEHARVLEVVADVGKKVAAGDVELGRVLARELPGWFALHAATMDAGLAEWLRRDADVNIDAEVFTALCTIESPSEDSEACADGRGCGGAERCTGSTR
jgi:hemerythrin-like metal-binding protein